jgi:hypothetical protein
LEAVTAALKDWGVPYDDYDPFNELMDDLLMEIKDHEAEKEQKKENKKFQEESLVAGGKLLCDKATQQILSGATVAIGCAEASLVTFRIWKHLLKALPPAARSSVPLRKVPLKLTHWSKRTRRWSWSSKSLLETKKSK